MPPPSRSLRTWMVSLSIPVLLWLVLLASTPLVSAQSAAESPRSIDLFFLMDDSSCLSTAKANDVPILEALGPSVDAIFEQLDPAGDRVAMIGFGDIAEQITPLTTDWAKLRADLTKLELRDGSARLDLAYREVADALKDGGAREGSLIVTLVLTDGPMMQFPELAQSQAVALSTDFGVRHYSIAVGTIAQFALLREISEPGGLWTLPFGGDLVSAYRKAGAAIVAKSLQTPEAVPTADPNPSPTVTPGSIQSRAYLPMLRRD